MVLSRKDIKTMTREQVNELFNRGELELSADYTYKAPTAVYEAIYNLIKEARIIVTYEGKELTEEEFTHRLFANFHSDYPIEVMTQALLEDEA